MPGNRILVVDDSRAVRRAVTLMLSTEAYDCLEAADGVEAVHLLETAEVDLVLTDLHMPNMDGFGLISAMRRLPNHRFTPVLVLTTECRDDVIKELQKSGVTGVLQKPIDRDGLRSAVKRCLA